MRILDIREQTVPISRYADPAVPLGDLTTSVVAVVTNAVRDGEAVVGYGFASFGRYGQGGLIRERFAPRLLAASTESLMSEDGSTLDPRHAWSVMMAGDRLAVDAMYLYGVKKSAEAATALAPYGLWWFEDFCDPLDFETLDAVARQYPLPIAAGEALFSRQEARLLHLHGGLRPDRDILMLDPVHCYGLTHYAAIVDDKEAVGWPRSAFWPHGGHLFSLHIAAALGLAGTEVNPLSFQPLGGLADDAALVNGCVQPPEAPGIGLETREAAIGFLRASLGE